MRSAPGVQRLLPAAALGPVWLIAISLFMSGCAAMAHALKNQPCELDERQPFTTVEVIPDQHELRLYWLDDEGQPFLSLEAVRRHLEAQGDSLVAATNAGIFEPGFEPTGLHVEQGIELRPVNRRTGEGNFFLKPNGIFLVDTDGQARVIQTAEWPVEEAVWLATQSGPLLARRGQTHPRFRDGSDSCRLRSGVGVREDGSVVLAISNGALNFHDFAYYFVEQLGAPDALYLDGGRSRLLYPAAGRFEDGQFAAILAVVARR